jgi:LmbE family N-acetylglucosaminyl deacetylase
MKKSKNKYQGMTILAVLAHPDDETFGMGGTLALYAQKGVSVHLICATRGEVGDVEPHFMEGYESIGELREHELRCAAEILGLSGVHFLDYRDSGMPGSPDNEHPQALAAAPLDEVAAKVTGYIRELQPQVVLTFDPIGGYRHPDHIAIHNATVQAFHAAGEAGQFPDEGVPFQPDKLYFHTFPRGLFTWMVRLLPLVGRDPRRFGRNGDIDLLELAGEEFPVHARINYSQVAKEKADATACHASQGNMGSSGSWLVNMAFRLAAGTDSFTRAYPEPDGNEKEKDLFAKIKMQE